MTDHQSIDTKRGDRARNGGQGGYGKAPLIAGGVLSVLLVGVLISGGIGAANAMTAPRTAASHVAGAQPTPNTGASAPVTDDPSTPPDRDSDQPVASKKEDTVYLIQRGDTLTAISAKLGMSIDSIAEYNAVRDVNVISEGSVLRVPFIYVPPKAATTE